MSKKKKYDSLLQAPIEGYEKKEFIRNLQGITTISQILRKWVYDYNKGKKKL